MLRHPVFHGLHTRLSVASAVALIVASVLLGGRARAQSLPTTNYENSGVVSEMIGSNAAGITAYTSDFVAQFTSERTKARVKAAVERLKRQRRPSRHLASRRPVAERPASHLGFVFAQSETENAERIHEALRTHEFESGPVRVLISSLRGLLSRQQIDATGFVEAVRAYNRVVEGVTDSVLADPPQELLSIRAVLASLMDAVTSEREVELSAALAFGRDSISPEQLPLPPPKRLDGIETKAPLIKPGTATATPTAFGARWGQVYGGVSYQPRSRYAARRDYDWRAGRWSDGTISFGAGVGNPHKWVGLDVTLNIFETLQTGSARRFGDERTLSLKLHRALPFETAVAVGYENAWRNSPEEAEGGNSFYGVVTKVFSVRAPRNSLFSRATVSVGMGNDRFLPESQYRRQAKGVNVFGSVGVRVWSFLNLVADWTGQDLNVGVSATPIPGFPLVLTPAFVDVTGRAGDTMRFSIGAALTYDFRR